MKDRGPPLSDLHFSGLPWPLRRAGSAEEGRRRTAGRRGAMAWLEVWKEGRERKIRQKSDRLIKYNQTGLFCIIGTKRCHATCYSG